MSIFNRHEKCFGITLYRFGRYRAEIWFCAPLYNIVEHSHFEEDVELMHIYGDTKFTRRNLWNGAIESVIPRMFQKFSVRHYHSHWFSVGKKWLVFINFQKFRKNYKPKSAAIDFNITKYHG